MPRPYWNISVDPNGHPGAINMATDRALLEEANRSGTATLRLYCWDPPCLSFGRNEPATRHYDRARIDQLGIDVVRRPTGGRGVWHEHEVTYAVAAPVTLFRSLRASYGAIHERLAAALRSLGADATLAIPRARELQEPRPNGRGYACFDSAVGGEVLIAGKKLVGSAHMQQGDALLQHGSILLEGSQDIVNTLSGHPSSVSNATTLSAVLGRSVTFEEVASTIVREWEKTFAVTAHCRLLPPHAAPFSEPLWTWRR